VGKIHLRYWRKWRGMRWWMRLKIIKKLMMNYILSVD
jgi:hypothetical protein